MNLKLRNIVKSYEFDPIFDEYNACFSTGLTQLSGDNGVGKTTLLRIIANQTYYEGEIYLDDTLLTCNDCVLVSQEMNLLDNLTVESNINYIVTKEDYKSSVIETFGLKPLLKNKVGTLSGGEKRKLSIIIALMIEPKVLLLDEIFTFLDAEAIELIKAVITSYAQNHIVILVDHNLSMTSNNIDLNLKDEIIKLEEIKIESNNDGLKAKKRCLTWPYTRSIIFNLLSPMFLVLIILNTLIAISFFVTQVTEASIKTEYYLKSNCEFYRLDNAEVQLSDEYDKYYTLQSGNNEFYGFAWFTEDFLEIVEQVNGNSKYTNCLVPDYSSRRVGDILTHNGEEYFIFAKFKTNMQDVENFGNKSIKSQYLELTSLIFIKTEVIPDNYSGIALKLNDRQVKELFNKDYLRNSIGETWEILSVLDRSIFVPVMLGITIVFVVLGSFYSLSNAKIGKYKRDFLISYSADKKKIFHLNFIFKSSAGIILFLLSTIIAMNLYSYLTYKVFAFKLSYPIGLTILVEIAYLIGFMIIDALINHHQSKKEIIN